MVTLYNVVSADGFIARKDGSEDFIPDDVWPNFLALCGKYGAIIMGRKTYDAIQAYPEELIRAFEKLPIRKIVVSANRSFRPKQEYIVAHSPEDAVALEPDALASSGPILNDYLLEKHLVGKVIFHELSISIGEGIRPFNTDKVSLVPVDDAPKLDGVTVREYRVE